MVKHQVIDETVRLVSEAEFATGSGRSADLMAEAVAAGELFFVAHGEQRLYPSFFFDSAYDKRELAAVTQLLGDLDGPTKWLFFTSGKGSLGGMSPLTALRVGKFASVKPSAEGAATR